MCNVRRMSVLAVVLLAFTFAACSKGDDAAPFKKASSAPAPAFTLTSVQGGDVSLSDFKGKVVVIDFWATWCPPCQRSIPHLVDLQTRYGSKGFSVVGISLDQNPNDLTGFLKQRPVNYPVLFGSEEVKQAYRVSSIPRIFILDREGVVQGDFLGFSDENAQAMEAIIAKAL